MQQCNEKNMQYRFENFGGIISSQNPPFLAFVDHDYMRKVGLGESVLWEANDTSVGLLSAPTEVHFAITNKCSVGCAHCYMNGGEKDDGQLDTESLKKALDILADMKVFHAAFGGGEALERQDLFDIAEYAKKIGIVPNLTVSGLGITPETAEKMKIFGQVNVSFDGVGEEYATFRGKDMFDVADKAIQALVAAGVSTGINCVVGKRNFGGIEKLFEFARARSVNEIEFLRFKPSGRGKALYFSERTTYEQNIRLVPLLAELSGKYVITAKIDCSFVPMLCYHNPPREMLEQMATYGCEAGNVLLGIRSNGQVSGCSFLESDGLDVFELSSPAKRKKAFENIFSWPQRAPQPCKSCDYLDICKGGCHSVSKHITASFDAPDPDCPIVYEFENGKGK